MARRISVIFLCSRENFRYLPLTFLAGSRPSSTFHEDEGPSINFRQHSERPRDLTSTSVNLPYGQEFHQLSVWLCDLSSTSCQLSVRPGDLPSNSVKFTGGRKTFHQCLQTFRSTRRPSVNFLSTFCLTVGPFMHFCQISIWS